MTAALAAAHIGHQIEHSSAMMGFLAGAAVGLAAAVTVVAVVGTGGAALGVIAAVGGIVAATGGGALAGMNIGRTFTSPKGPILTGSSNVFWGPARIPAARAIVDIVACKSHGTAHLATGSDSVFINGFPAARDTDQTDCAGVVASDLTHILIGAETVQYLDIQSEVPEWLVNLATGMVIVGSIMALGAGGIAAFTAGSIGRLAAFSGVAAGKFAGGEALTAGLGAIGWAIGGARGRAIGEALSMAVGGKRRRASARPGPGAGKPAPPKGGAERAARYGKNWPSGDLAQSRKKFAGEKPIITETDKGKRIYKNPDTGVEVVEDLNGGYYRIHDPNLPGKRKYLDLDGNIPNNKIENGRQMGRSQAEYNEVTHFRIDE